MNAVQTLLEERADALGLVGSPPLACLLVTPRFHASRHVVALLLAGPDREPSLVAKLPRLPEDRQGVEREAALLAALHARRPGGFDSLPRPLGLETHRGWPVLIETALVGAPWDPPAVRGAHEAACRAVSDWICELQQSAPPARRDGAWFARVLDEPAQRVSRVLALDREEARGLAASRAALGALAELRLGAALEHGDLSHPNLLRLPDGRLGVLDWETAELDGLPSADLFFFLAYAAFARAAARSTRAQLAAFESAFFAPGAWAIEWAEGYARRVGLDLELLGPLLAFVWVRAFAGLIGRVAGEAREPDAGQRAWLLGHRFAALLRSSLTRATTLRGGTLG